MRNVIKAMVVMAMVVALYGCGSDSDGRDVVVTPPTTPPLACPVITVKALGVIEHIDLNVLDNPDGISHLIQYVITTSTGTRVKISGYSAEVGQVCYILFETKKDKTVDPASFKLLVNGATIPCIMDDWGTVDPMN